MTVERSVVIWRPLVAKSLSTVRNAAIASAVVAVIFAIFDGQFFFIVTESDGACVVVDGVNVEYFNELYNKLDATLYSYAPFVVMMVANAAIVVKMVKARREMNKVGQVGATQAPGTALSKTAKKTTLMLLAVSLVFCALTVPVSTYYAVTNDVPPLSKALLVNLGYVNHGINFLLYCLTGSKFRAEVLKRLPCRRRETSGESTLTSRTEP